MRIAYFEPLSRAWARTRVILWQPFDLTKWLLLAFAAWVAGLTFDAGSAVASRADSSSGSGQPWRGFEHAWDRMVDSAVWLPLALMALMIGIAITLLVLWLSSRAKFVFLDNLVRNRGEIVEPWTRFERLGNSLFLWRLCFAVACGLAAVLVMILFFAPAAGLSLSDTLAGLSVAAGVFGGLGLVVLGVVAAFVALMTEAFVIPIMYRYDLKVLDAWRSLMPWLKARPGHFVLYALFVLLLAIVYGAFFSVFCLVTCCIAAFPYIGTALLLPVWVTYRLLSVEFLAQFHPDFNLFRPLPTEPEDAISGLAD
jgi:hypothetical protein